MAGAKKSFADYMAQYEEEHRKASTRLTHMFGIPMILVSLVYVFFDWRIGALLFVVGWILQFIGHWVFERNNPAFFQGPLYLVAGAAWSFKEWGRVLTGKGLGARPTAR